MIVNDEDAIKRLNNPMNLINKLKSSTNNSRTSAMSLFGIGKREDERPKPTFNPFATDSIRSSSNEISSRLDPALVPQPLRRENVVEAETEAGTNETLDNILDNYESQIKLGLAHDNALDLLNKSVSALVVKLDDIRADKLPSVVLAASKTVESIRRERSDSLRAEGEQVHYHFYAPPQKTLRDYEIIEVHQ